MLNKGRNISFDIDGVLNNYPLCWVEFINKELKTNFLTKESAKKELGSEKYSLIKKKYRNSHYKENLPINEEMKKIIMELINSNNNVFIATSRPMDTEEYPNLRRLTQNWLNKNNISHTRLLNKDKEGNYIDEYSINVHIDDELEYIKKAKEKNVKAILFSKYSNQESEKNIINIKSELELREELK